MDNQQVSPDNPIGLVAFDLDGTILDRGETIVPECAAAIRRAHEAGIRCVVDSGRSAEFSAELLERLGLLDCFDAVIGDERWIQLVEAAPDRPTVRTVVGLRSWNDEVEQRWQRLEPVATQWCERVEERARERGWTPELIGRQDTLRRGLAAIWFAADEQAQELLSWLLPQLAGSGLAANSNGGYIHVYDEQCDKGSALLRVAEHFEIPAGSVVAFGDNINDQPMLDGRYGFGAVAVANAKPVVKEWVRAAGGRVADRPSGLGVAEMLGALLPSPDDGALI